MTLRDLLIQRSARLQEYPALTAPPWGQLRYPQFRNRVEGVALGLILAGPEAFHSATGSPWDWACEVACACCGFGWEPGAPAPAATLLGGAGFNDEHGRQPYHDRGDAVLESTPFSGGLDQGELLRRLRRLNSTLGWDHSTSVTLPLDQLGSPAVRAALWSALYAGSHATLATGNVPVWDPAPFSALWSL